MFDYPIFPICGTSLGLLRHGKIINYDNDIDFVIYIEDKNQKESFEYMKEKLEKNDKIKWSYLGSLSNLFGDLI